MAQYFFSTTLSMGFNESVDRVTAALAQKGFGVLTEIDVKATLKKKLGIEFRPYKILGACNPHFAHRALQVDDKIGTMMPCNVIVQDTGGGQTEVTAIDPVASMQAADVEALRMIAEEVRQLLQDVIRSV